MALDFSKAIKSVEASINKYLIKGQAIPTNSLSYYNDLRTANGSAGGNSGGGGTTNGPNTPTVYEGILEPNYYNVLSTTVPQEIVSSNSTISYILIQNNGSHNIYFTPIPTGAGFSLINGPVLVIVPGGSWSSDIAQFITNGIYAQAHPDSTTISLTTFIIYSP